MPSEQCRAILDLEKALCPLTKLVQLDMSRNSITSSQYWNLASSLGALSRLQCLNRAPSTPAILTGQLIELDLMEEHHGLDQLACALLFLGRRSGSTLKCLSVSSDSSRQSEYDVLCHSNQHRLLGQASAQ